MNTGLIELVADKTTMLNLLTRLNNGSIEETLGDFAETFSFNDRGTGLEFTSKDRLREFFQKERELYPTLSFQIEKLLVTEDHVIAEWRLEYSIKQPFYGNTERSVPVLLRGVSLVRTSEGKIIEWTDYYDGLTSRRTALASYFVDWVDL